MNPLSVKFVRVGSESIFECFLIVIKFEWPTWLIPLVKYYDNNNFSLASESQSMIYFWR